MNLNRIIENLKTSSIVGTTDIEISDIVYDSRKVTKNCVFVCLSGVNFDGHEFISKAIVAGAKAVIVEKDIKIAGATIIRVENSRAALSHISANFFGHPANEIKTIAITGTKGKTTTSFMIKSILEESGAKVGLIGTIGIVMGKEVIPMNNTTPESYEMHKYLRKIVQSGCKYAVVEASSIGLARNRLDDINFDIGIFTNISHDHIGDGEHKDFEEYLNSKALLFKKCKIGIINKDDPNHEKVTKNHTCKIRTFALNSTADYNAENLNLINENGKIGISFSATGKAAIKNIFVSIPGEFNVYNSLAAIAATDSLEIPKNFISKGLEKTKVKGRFEALPTAGNYSMFIDYAHNALSMENILKTIRKYNPKRIVTLFGAGGNRPKIRRYEMGEVSGRLSDVSVITSDNPRFEEPLDIIQDIKTGINKTSGKYTIVPDRKEAIEFCIKNAKDGDVIILAGKGHEDYQEIKGVKYPFDERKVVSEIFKKLGLNAK